MKILKVTCLSNPNSDGGIVFQSQEMEVKETAKSYITSNNSRINKDKFLVAESTLTNYGWNGSFGYFTHCLPEQTKQAGKILREAVIKRYEELKPNWTKIDIAVEKIREHIQKQQAQ